MDKEELQKLRDEMEASWRPSSDARNFWALCPRCRHWAPQYTLPSKKTEIRWHSRCASCRLLSPNLLQYSKDTMREMLPTSDPMAKYCRPREITPQESIKRRKIERERMRRYGIR